MPNKKKVLILAFSRLQYDARITRQIKFLMKDYEVEVFCFSKTDIPGVHFYEVGQTSLTLFRKAFAALFLITRQYKRVYWILHNYKEYLSILKKKNYDLIIANDVETLHFGFNIAKTGNGKVLFDAHEYAPRHFEDKLWFRLFFQGFNKYFCNIYIPRVSAMTTVCDGLAEEYEKHFGLKPEIITNAPGYQENLPKNTNPDKIRLIHMGTANFSRKLENMIDVVNLLDDRYTLDLMLLTPAYASPQTKDYVENLKQEIAENPKVKIIDPVPSSQVVNKIKSYDMGIFLLEPVNFNYTFALPNKLFEFIQARLAIAIGPSPEMAKIVHKYGCGVVSVDFTPASLAKAIQQLSVTDIDKMKANCQLAATEESAEKNEEKLRAICNNLLQ